MFRFGARRVGTEHRVQETTHPEFAEAHNLPFEATRGGKATIYPEFMDKIEAMRKADMAKKEMMAKEAAANIRVR